MIQQIEDEVIRQTEAYKAPRLLILSQEGHQKLRSEISEADQGVLKQLITSSGVLDIGVNPFLNQDFLVVDRFTEDLVATLVAQAGIQRLDEKISGIVWANELDDDSGDPDPGYFGT